MLRKFSSERVTEWQNPRMTEGQGKSSIAPLFQSRAIINNTVGWTASIPDIWQEEKKQIFRADVREPPISQGYKLVMHYSYLSTRSELLI